MPTVIDPAFLPITSAERRAFERLQHRELRGNPLQKKSPRTIRAMGISRRKLQKRRRPRRSYRAPRISMGVPSGASNQQIVRMRYAETVNLTSTVGSLDSVVFRANGVFDPNHTGTGHQPMGYDQYSALFNHTIVLGSKMTCRWFIDTGANAPMQVGSYLSDTTTVPYTTPDEFIEAKKGTARTYNGRQAQSVITTSKFSTRGFFKVKDVSDNVDRLGAGVGGTPSEQATYVIWFATSNGSTDTMYCQVTIDYIVMFSEPKDLPQS